MLQPADIRQVWDQILPGLLDLKARYPLDWRPEDVYAACVNGTSELFLSDSGFLVTELTENQFDTTLEFLVWVAYDRSPDAQSRYLSEVEAMARARGAKRLVMVSSRKGWERAGYWTATFIHYERDLDDVK